MSDHRKKFSFDNINSKLIEFSNVYDNLTLKGISQFLEKNPEFINHREEKSGCTLLANAVLNGNFELVQNLLEIFLADPNIQNVHGMTPLHFAVESENPKIINLLLEKGANPNIAQQDGETPLHLAANNGDYKVIKLLCLFGADINTLSINELSVLDYAIQRGNQKCIEVIKSLIEKEKSENNENTTIDNKLNIYHYPEDVVSEVPTGFKTTKNSDSPINRIKENMNIPFYTPDFIYKDYNFQNYTSKNSRSPFMNYKSYSSNTHNPSSSKINKNPILQYSFQNNPNTNLKNIPESQYERGISFYPDYNSAESKRYLDEYDSVNHKKKNYFSDKYSLRESSSFFIQMNDFEQRLEKIKKDLLENVADAYENNIEGENEQMTTNHNVIDNSEIRDKYQDKTVLADDTKAKEFKSNDENYFSLANPNYNLDISETKEEDNTENHKDNQEGNNENTNNVNIENLNTPYLNTYSTNSKYNNSYSNLAQRLTFTNQERREIVRNDNYATTYRSENETTDIRAPLDKQESINYMSFINDYENKNENHKNNDMPRRFVIKDKSQPISPIIRTLDDNKYPSTTSLRKNTKSNEENNFALNVDEIQTITLQPNYIESENNLSRNLIYNRVDTHNTNPESNNNLNFNDNSANNVYDYYHNVPSFKNNMSNNLFSLSNTKTNEYLMSELELTNEISKIKKLLSESFYEDGRVLTVFYSNRNDINENYVKKKIIKEESPNVIKSRPQNNNFGETTQTRKKIEELLNFNIQEFEEYIKSSVLKDEEEDEDESPSTKQSPEVSSPKKKNKRSIKDQDLHSVHSINSQPVNNRDINYDKFSSLAILQQTHSVKYLAKTNRSLKDRDDYKQMSMDTYTIDEVSVTICPKSMNDTIDKMNMITADIKHNGIDQIEFEYNSTEAMKEVDTFMKGLELERYTATFIKHGFDDMKMIIDQMNSETAITDKNLKEIGILLPGHRAKILLKLEERSFEFPLPTSVYHTVDPSYNNLEDMISDQNMYSIHSWLTGLKMERYTLNFFNCGYHSLELLFLQMNSKNPLTEKMLEEEIKIKKIGYRIRLLKKLRDDGKEYFNKLKNLHNVKLLDQKNPSSLDSCKCIIF